MKLSVIVPVYNEEQTIGEVIDRIQAVDLGDTEVEIIFANDGSDDGTRRVLVVLLVLSAGPDGIIDTPFLTASELPAGDDVGMSIPRQQTCEPKRRAGSPNG